MGTPVLVFLAIDFGLRFVFVDSYAAITSCALKISILQLPR
jgi:hypothetical protein